MDKQEILLAVKQLSANKELTQEELNNAFSAGLQMPAGQEVPAHNRLKLSDIMYYLGGAIVFLGIAVLVSQNWDYFPSFLRILVTLGSMIAAFIVAAIFYRYENFSRISQAFFLLSGMLAPLGVEVTLKEMGFDLSLNSVQLLAFMVMSAVFLGAFYYYKKAILLFFGIAFVTGIFHYIVNIVVGNNLDSKRAMDIWEYRILVLGLAYMFLGYYLSQTSQKDLTGIMYGFGSLFFLGAAIALGGWQPYQNAFWEISYPFLVFGIIFLSVFVKSRSFLVFGTMFLIGYILKLTGEYFSSGLGWPLALVLAGLAIMGVGYYAVKLNKKYLNQHI